MDDRADFFKKGGDIEGLSGGVKTGRRKQVE